MAYNTRKMLEDSNGDLIPQYFNQQSDVYEHLQGAQGVNFVGNHVLTDSGIWVPQRGTEDGAAHTQLTGSNIVYTQGLNANIDPGTNLEIISGVDISRFAKIVISFHFDSGRERFQDGAGRLLVQSSRISESYTGSTVVDRQLLTMGSGVNRPYSDDPTRGAYQTDILTITGQYLFVEIQNIHDTTALLGLRSVVVKGVV